MARLNKRETFKLCDRLILADIFQAMSTTSQQFHYGYSAATDQALAVLGVSAWAISRCHDIGREFVANTCPGREDRRCILGCLCRQHGLTAAVDDPELLYNLGYITWEEFEQRAEEVK